MTARTRAEAEQPGLWELPEMRPASPGRPPRPRVHAPRVRPTGEHLSTPCEPSCIVCGHPEGRGACWPRCPVLCAHSTEASLAEVCIVTTHVTARLVVGLPGAGEPGRRLAVVSCPFCERPHAHTAAYGVRYQISGCGQPYIVHLQRPPITRGGAP